MYISMYHNNVWSEPHIFELDHIAVSEKIDMLNNADPQIWISVKMRFYNENIRSFKDEILER